MRKKFKLLLRGEKRNVRGSIVMHTLTSSYRFYDLLDQEEKFLSKMKFHLNFVLHKNMILLGGTNETLSRIIRCQIKLLWKSFEFHRKIFAEKKEVDKTLNRFNKKSFCTFSIFSAHHHPLPVNSSASMRKIKADESIKKILKCRVKNDSENFSSFFFSASTKKGRSAVDKELSPINIPNIGKGKIFMLHSFPPNMRRGMGERIIGWWRDLLEDP